MSTPKTYSFKKLNQIGIAVALILAIGLIGLIWIAGEYINHEKKIATLKKDYIEIRKLESKTLVNNIVNGLEFQKDEVEIRLKKSLTEYANQALTICNTLYEKNKNTLNQEELKELIISTLMPIRLFDGRGYFWIHDTNHHLIAHPFRKNSIGKHDAELTDTKGQKIIRSFVKAATQKKSGGFVIYYWSKPGVDERYHKEQGQKKISYLILFEPFNWVIGIGEYVADVEKQVQDLATKRLSTVRYNEKGYIFTHTKEGICLNHYKKENIGKNRWELEDASGMKVVQELNRVGRQYGGGFLEYGGSINPDTNKPAQKLSFVRSVEKWEWVIGSGVYLADIEWKIIEYKKELYSHLKKKIAIAIAILLIILFVGFWIGNQFLKGLLEELNLFVNGSSDPKKPSIDPNKFRIRELKTIAEQANHLQVENIKIQSDLNRAKRMESIGIMAGGVAHDLNNILSGIVGYPELLLHKLPPDSELRKPLLAIHDSGTRASTIVADLLTIARSAASTREVHDLNTLISQYINSPEFFELQSQNTPIEFTYTLSKDQLLINCSPVHIKKCLMNLVVNAAEAIEKSGEISLTTYIAEITQQNLNYIDLENGTYIFLTICDTGPGISNEDIEHIFEPFYTRKTMDRSGTGLGLTVVWNTMDDHDGKIKVESSEKGTCFHLMFPLSESNQITDCDSSGTFQKTGNNEQILVVDDEPYLQDIACQMLKELGYKVNSVSSGEQAVEYIKNNHVDLLILDMLMEPKMNGRETYEAIIQLFPNIKAVIASGFSNNDEIQKALQLGVNGFIQKPYSIEKLGEIVRNALNE